MKLGIISLGGKSSKSILKESKAYFSIADHLDIRHIKVNVNTEGLQILHKEEPIERYDCVYIRGSYKYALLQESITEALYKHSYMPFTSKSFNLAHNKFLTFLALQNSGISLPSTYLAATVNGAKELLKTVNYPIIMKIPTGTQGKGVVFADSEASAKSIIDALEVFKQPYLIQEFIDTGATDVRIIVAGEKILGSMKRKAVASELRANIHMGGIGANYIPDQDTSRIAIKAAKAIGADLCAVDILEGRKPNVIELNLSPGLEGITKATKKNIAKSIAIFLYEKTKEFKEKQKQNDYKEIINNIQPNDEKEILTTLNIQAGVIKLPSVITKITKFNPDKEVVLRAQKGKLLIKNYEIGEEEK